MNNQKLEKRLINQITGTFQIPAYQRGYRWEHKHVEKLLDDLLAHVSENPVSGKSPYYLQPIVIVPSKKVTFDAGVENCEPAIEADGSQEVWNLIDGQQRLTTLYLILRYLEQEQYLSDVRNERVKLLAGKDLTPKYEIVYSTRNSSGDFIKRLASRLENKDKTDEEIKVIEEALKQEASTSPDFLYMWHAYKFIEKWFDSNYNTIGSIADAILNDVKVIWYEMLPDSSTPEYEKFAELNIGKIQLTNSELVKALLMRSDTKDITKEQKNVIIQQWDAIEKELDDDHFWGFLSSRDKTSYSTRIDLLFDIIAQKPKNSDNEFYTFDFFERLFSGADSPKGKDKWNNIYLQYLRLREWYLDREYYHKIGFLSTIDSKETLFQDLFEFVSIPDEKTNANPTNGAFKRELEERIIEAIKLPDDVKSIEELVYKKPDDTMPHYEIIKRLLTLYNVIFTLNLPKERYDFASHKNVRGGWSLEHIHAQNSEPLQKMEDQKIWLTSHRESLLRYKSIIANQELSAVKEQELDELADEMEKYSRNGVELTSPIFDSLFNRFSKLIVPVDNSKVEQSDYEHQFSNMALLGKDMNAAFNNSTFDVKRHKMLQNISTEHFPVCTQRVFLKSITDCDDNHPFFWGAADREAYIRDIRTTLSEYLPKVEKTSVDTINPDNENQPETEF